MITAAPLETRIYLWACGGLLALSAAVSGSPPLGVQVAILAFGVLVFGLPHGALDPLIARRAGLTPGRAGVIAFHLAYGAAALVVLMIWMAAPLAALIGFLGYSAYHFAGDWTRGLAPRLALGAAVLSLPCLAHADDVGAIYALLSGEAGNAVAAVQNRLWPFWIGIIAFAGVSFARQGRISAALELAMLVTTALVLSPLLFFAAYFCALHSPRHFLALWRRFTDRRAPAICAAVYTGLAAVMAIGAAIAFRPADLNVSALGLQTVFIALAALTAPHLILSSLIDRLQSEGDAHALPPVNRERFH